MRTLARRLEDEQIARRKKKGKQPKARWGAAMVTWTEDKLPVPMKHKPREKPAREDAVIIDWTTEQTRGFRAALSSKDKGKSRSVKTSGAVQAEEAASEAGFHSPGGSRDSAQEARRSNLRGTRTHLNFNDSDGDIPEHFSRRASPLFNVGLESTSSWTSQAVDDDYDEDEDDIYDEDRLEENAVSPEASSVYSHDDSKALTKWEGSDGPA
ncbi:uncharacterized protein TrAtP1_004931 [Trichoderma atroviride]|uniref:uncharacterized protein n=1 Tax=Hypocrea atroviridis TaxID=63577 RepID=UPI00332E7C7E|nr:hypothetical protein TrAtP1_004931 [Trichoderma atroviride]